MIPNIHFHKRVRFKKSNLTEIDYTFGINRLHACSSTVMWPRCSALREIRCQIQFVWFDNSVVPTTLPMFAKKRGSSYSLSNRATLQAGATTRRWLVDGSAFGAYGLCKYKSTPRSSRLSLRLRQVLQSQQTVHSGVTCRVCIIRAILVISFRRRLSIIVQEFLLSLQIAEQSFHVN